MRELCIPKEIRDMISAGAVVAFGISGGKDSTAMALDVNRWLDIHEHPRELRCCIHSDLGQIEWPQTMDWVRKTAEFVDLPLHIVKRNKGDMLDRWEQRWADNLQRYQNLECLTLITPWSSAQWRFCTSELKVGPITAFLKKEYAGKTILNLTGIRRQESPGRSKAEVFKEMPALRGQMAGTRGFSWNPLLEYTLDDVYEVHRERGFPLHPAYTEYGSSRLSCSMCILATQNDQLSAMKMEENHGTLMRIAKLELDSTFSFQPNRWALDLRPDLIPMFWDADDAKLRAAQRQQIERRLPADARQMADAGTVSRELAEIIASVRKDMGQVLQIQINNTKTEEILYAFNAV